MSRELACSTGLMYTLAMRPLIAFAFLLAEVIFADSVRPREETPVALETVTDTVTVVVQSTSATTDSCRTIHAAPKDNAISSWTSSTLSDDAPSVTGAGSDGPARGTSPPPPVATLYSEAAVQHHNIHRANHSADAVAWDPDLAASALKCAQMCSFQHQVGVDGMQYGQNLALGLPDSKIASIITDMWYSEVDKFTHNYGNPNPPRPDDWGHFTAMIWKSTSKIGCATYHCDSIKTNNTDPTPMDRAFGTDITYCNYQPTGNVMGNFGQNVGTPNGAPQLPPDYNVDESAIAVSYPASIGQTSDTADA
ncbi:hypothetical protein ANO11243_097090 [Dothideomycetidae sp. 11243]|nr:hypothetical protein ANO11243_097090 [fungal sp. No.11243]